MNHLDDELDVSRLTEKRRKLLIMSALAALAAALFWTFVIRNVTLGPRHVDQNTFLPLPTGVELLASQETGCNNAGPEPGYLVLLVLIGSSDTQSDAELIDRLHTHLRGKGFDAPAERGGAPWAERLGSDGSVEYAVGSLAAVRSFAGSDDALLSWENLALPELERAALAVEGPLAVARFEPLVSCF